MFCYVCFLICTSLTYKLSFFFHFTSNTTSLMPTPAKPAENVHLLFTQHLQNRQRMELLSTPFPQTAQGNLLSVVTFLVFSLLIIIFVFLTFTLNPFDSNAAFQVSSLPFQGLKHFTNAKSSA